MSNSAFPLRQTIAAPITNSAAIATRAGKKARIVLPHRTIECGGEIIDLTRGWAA